jgi:lipopolysaccharide/colanic/teichoic acid biosynthesis glycosyltransferase
MAVTRDSFSLRHCRFCDILIACVAIAFCLPLLASIALVIKADGSGPVLCRRLHICRDGRWIHTFAFRITANRSRWMHRVQPVLRRTRIEMLPQTIDVLRGNLTFIGRDRPGFLMP